MTKYFLLINFIFIQSTHAMFNSSELMTEFYRDNTQLFRVKEQVKIDRFRVEEIKASKFWGLKLLSSYTDSELDQLSRLGNKSETILHSLTLSKYFKWGGVLSFENGFQKIDQEATIFNSFPSAYGFTQKLSYSQDLGRDIFGKSFQQDILLAELQLNLDDQRAKTSEHSLLLKFYQAYSQARLQKTLIVLQRQAKIRAEKRFRLVGKKVRDGIREKIDLLQAKMSVLGINERAQEASIQLQTSLQNVAEFLHRPIKSLEIQAYGSEDSEEHKIPQGHIDDNIELKEVRIGHAILKQTIDQLDYKVMPDIKIVTDYVTNDYDSVFSESIKNGKLGGNQNEFKVALQVSWSLGAPVEEAQKAQALIKLKTQKRILESEINNLKVSERYLKERVLLLQKNISSVLKRIQMAKEVVKEVNRLYLQGRVELDRVIQSEEDLISTEISLAQFLYQRDSLIASMAFLYGNLPQYLISYKKHEE